MIFSAVPDTFRVIKCVRRTRRAPTIGAMAALPHSVNIPRHRCERTRAHHTTAPQRQHNVASAKACNATSERAHPHDRIQTPAPTLPHRPHPRRQDRSKVRDLKKQDIPPRARGATTLRIRGDAQTDGRGEQGCSGVIQRVASTSKAASAKRGETTKGE